jgi:ankyrin repeat protein
LNDNPFYAYATQYWAEHLKEVQDVPEKAVCSFLLDQGKVASARQAELVSKDEPQEDDFGQVFDNHESGLHLAVQFGLASVVTILLANGQRTTMKDSQGRTPLWRATENGKSECMQLLSPLDRITFGRMLDINVQLAHLLLQITGRSIRSYFLRTPLHEAVTRNDLDLARVCIAHGLDINATDIEGRTPIRHAIEKQATQIIELLLDSGASTELISAGEWLKAYGKPATNVVKLLEDANGKLRVSFVSAEDFEGPSAEDFERSWEEEHERQSGEKVPPTDTTTTLT